MTLYAEILPARTLVISVRAQIEAEINRLAERAARQRSIQAYSTTGISRKARALIKIYVTDRLLHRFDDEAKAFRLPERAIYRFCRIVALAAFLPDLDTRDEHSAIVLDDPV